MRLIKDSSGRKSWHVTLGVIWTTIFSVKALFGGHDITAFGIHFLTATVPGSEYLLYISPWLAAMGFRDWNKKGETNGNSPSVSG